MTSFETTLNDNGRPAGRLTGYGRDGDLSYLLETPLRLDVVGTFLRNSSKALLP